MKYRKLRIASSAVCGILCLLLIALWVRSYWWHNAVTYRDGKNIFGVGARQGIIAFEKNVSGERGGWKISNTPVIKAARQKPSFHVVDHPTASGVAIPLRFLVALSAALAAAIWIRRRFSLRTLLAGLMILAVVLGLIAVQL